MVQYIVPEEAYGSGVHIGHRVGGGPDRGPSTRARSPVWPRKSAEWCWKTWCCSWSKVRLRSWSSSVLYTVQGDPSRCSQGVVDIKTKVAFFYKEHNSEMQPMFWCQQNLGNCRTGHPIFVLISLLSCMKLAPAYWNHLSLKCELRNADLSLDLRRPILHPKDKCR